ncbi:MAG TPA: helix-hairpin-helix domain-containing protein [Longimicrobiales bacterium]|nr:helix-hairpin-helix domain-containing protein [Longimicrobiales bacterium]
MKLTDDESRALAFVAAVLLLSAAVRVSSAREPVPVPAGAAEGFDFAAHVDATRSAVAAAERAARPLAAGERLDPNGADATELDRLPRVGPALAARIVEDRARNGPFRSAEDLLRVRGVGPRMLAEVRPHLDIRAGGVSGGPPGPVDLNRADAAALATLPGIGPVLAGRIVAYRDSAGAFRDLEALGAVRGVGPATLERVRARVRVRPP